MILDKMQHVSTRLFIVEQRTTKNTTAYVTRLNTFSQKARGNTSFNRFNHDKKVLPDFYKHNSNSLIKTH